MSRPDRDEHKKVKNIAAVVYLLVLGFLVGGSYLHQQRTETAPASSELAAKPQPQ
ncbi:hypothetical protein [Methylomonas koyamae]|uniref:hypothetical protein n=1 Tax=Methylomonas koyamae TaxID=702114 RepID=UPI000AD23B68|nr:hypothetical protein [Methylomonas koyamae]